MTPTHSEHEVEILTRLEDPLDEVAHFDGLAVLQSIEDVQPTWDTKMLLCEELLHVDEAVQLDCLIEVVGSGKPLPHVVDIVVSDNTEELGHASDVDEVLD